MTSHETDEKNPRNRLLRSLQALGGTNWAHANQTVDAIDEMITRQMARGIPQKSFAEAMVEVARATDGQGRAVMLYYGNWTADSLAEATREFAETVLPRDAIFLSGLSEESQTANKAAAAAAWENLAKLASATAAAIREGR